MNTMPAIAIGGDTTGCNSGPSAARDKAKTSEEHDETANNPQRPGDHHQAHHNGANDRYNAGYQQHECRE